jgi:hypothetical protein
MSTTATIIGYIASGLVLTTFWTNDLRRLRILAILSNIAFITYGALVWLPPVLGLHLLLLPLNTVRLMRMSKTAPEVDHHNLPSKLMMLLGRVGAMRAASLAILEDVRAVAARLPTGCASRPTCRGTRPPRCSRHRWAIVALNRLARSS